MSAKYEVVKDEKYMSLSSYDIYDVKDVETGKTVACFFESGLDKAWKWADKVCELFNEDVKP